MTVYSLFAQAATGTTVVDDFGQYSMGMQFTLSTNASLTGIWWNSPPSSTALPDACCIYVAVADTQVPGTLNSSPTWSGAAGSGWVKCTYPGTVTLNSGTSYKVVIHLTGAEFKYGATAAYWSTGAGSGGITNGIITGVNNATGDGGQDTFIVGATLGYPNSSNGANYWVDVEVSTGAPPVTQHSTVGKDTHTNPWKKLDLILLSARFRGKIGLETSGRLAQNERNDPRNPRELA